MTNEQLNVKYVDLQGLQFFAEELKKWLKSHVVETDIYKELLDRLEEYLKIEDSPFEKGENENSAVLKGGNNIAMEILSTTSGLNNASLGPYSNSEGYASKSILEYYDIDDIKYSNENEDAIRDLLYQKYLELKDADPTGDKLFSIAWNLGSHTEGRNGLSLGERAHTEGVNNIAYGHNSHTEGQWNVAKGNNSHAEGSTNIAEGRNSHVEGNNNKSIGEASHTEGVYLQAAGKASHAEGLGADTYEYGAFGNYSHHEGGYNKVNGAYSHGEGANNETEGTAVHVEGRYNIAKGNFAHAEGRYTQTFNEAEHAEGFFNVSHTGKTTSQKTIHSVGVGPSENSRKNAHEILANGKHYILGVGNYDGTKLEGATDVAAVIDSKADKSDLEHINVEQLVKISYSDLKSLRDKSQLVPGQQYRITDYITTTVQENTRSANNQFDVIVTADDVNVLNARARAIQHEFDDPESDKAKYFANSKLAVWELKYRLDNDTIFEWADKTNGKGVIYYMKDEYGNECPYDFKNIQFKNVDSRYFELYVYTFNRHNEIDWSMGGAWLNSIKPYYNASKYRYALNNIILYVSGNYKIYNNTFDYNCHDIFSYNSFYLNTFGKACFGLVFGGSTYSNKFGNDCRNSNFGSNFRFNVINPYCRNIQVPDFCRTCTFNVGCRIVMANDETASSNNSIQNYIIGSDLGGNTVQVSRGRDYTTYIMRDAYENIKQFCIADLI